MSDDGWSTPTLHGSRPPGDPEAADPGAESASDAVHASLATGLQHALDPDPFGPLMGEDGGWSSVVVHGHPDTGDRPDRHDADVAWSPATYGGSRLHRPHLPGRGRGADPDVAEPDVAEPDVDEPDVDEPGTAGPEDGPAVTTALPAPERVATAAGAGDPAAARATPSSANRRLLSSSRTMAIASLVSRLTGLLRTLAIAAALGSAVGSVADPYNTANSLPNMVYELLVGGVLSSVLIPLIVYAQEHDRDGGEAYTQRLLSIATAALGAATLLAVLAAPWITYVVIEADKRPLTTIFATLLLPEIFFYGVGALLMAVLNSRNVYGPGAWAPVVNNVVVIATVAVFLVLPGGTPTLGGITDTQILVLGGGTTLGIVAQAVVLLPFLRRSGFHWRWRFRASAAEESGRLGEVRTLALWVLGYVAASQVGVVVIQRVGSAQGPVGYSTFVYADLLFQVPYGILGVSLLTALMPRMSRAAAGGDLRAVVDDLGLGARLSAVALVPITFGLVVLGPSLTTTVFLGKFEPSAATLVGVVLALSAFGLLPFAIVMLQLRVFYAMRDARTPTLVNLGMVGTKVVLVLLAVLLFDSPVRVIEALSVATSASYVVGMVLGHVLLRRRLGGLGLRAVGVTVLRMAAASAAGALVAALVVWGVHTLLHGPRLAALTSLVLGAVLGGAVMALAALRLRIPEIQDVVAAVRPARGGAARNTPPAAVVGPDESRTGDDTHHG